MELQKVIDHLRRLPNTFVDQGYGQDRESLLRHIQEQTGKDKSAVIDAHVLEVKKSIERLVERAAPYEMPREYTDFLVLYGGVAIWGLNYNFATYGIGPMTEEHYGGINSEDTLKDTGTHGFLSIGYLSFGESHKLSCQHVAFLLDLAGRVQKHCVIGIGPWKAEPFPKHILSDLHAYPNSWRKVSNSFAEWLAYAAETNGTFDYEES